MIAYFFEFMNIQRKVSNTELTEEETEQPSPEKISELESKTDLTEPNPGIIKSDV